MIGEVLSALNILEKAGKFLGWVRQMRASPAETLGERFIRLFESHDVRRNQIPRFFDHGLTLRDLQNNDSLFEKLNEPLLEAACKIFGVRREWLEGVDSQIYPCHDFYKSPEDVAPFLDRLKESNAGGGLDGILIAPEEQTGGALIVLREGVGSVGQKPIYRYPLCNNWVFDYWKSRAYLTAFVAIAWRRGVYIRGAYSPLEEIKRVVSGEFLLSNEYGEAAVRKSAIWHPEDMALEPTTFLSGVDQEEAAFGQRSALKLWLALEKEGHMATGLPMYSRREIRQKFERALVGS